MGSIGVNISNTLQLAGYTAKETDYYTYKEGALYRNVAAGQFLTATRPTRIAGNYKIYVDSFPSAALPYSNYHIANIKTGRVYDMEVRHGTGVNTLKEVVEELKRR